VDQHEKDHKPTSESLLLALFTFFFSAKKQACGPEGRAFRGKSIGPSISDFELRISDFLGFFSIPIPQSTIRNPDGPPGPRNDPRLMVFPRNALPFGPGNA